MSHQLLMQAFEWYLPADAKHWQRLKSSIPELQQLGVSQLWLPPAFKGTSSDDVGYGVYDLFDLGEFDQKWDCQHKIWQQRGLFAADCSPKRGKIKPIADVVLNHKANGDHKERFSVIKMNQRTVSSLSQSPMRLKAGQALIFPADKIPIMTLNGTGIILRDWIMTPGLTRQVFT